MFLSGPSCHRLSNFVCQPPPSPPPPFFFLLCLMCFYVSEWTFFPQAVQLCVSAPPPPPPPPPFLSFFFSALFNVLLCFLVDLPFPPPHLPLPDHTWVNSLSRPNVCMAIWLRQLAYCSCLLLICRYEDLIFL